MTVKLWEAGGRCEQLRRRRPAIDETEAIGTRRRDAAASFVGYEHDGNSLKQLVPSTADLAAHRLLLYERSLGGSTVALTGSIRQLQCFTII